MRLLVSDAVVLCKHVGFVCAWPLVILSIMLFAPHHAFSQKLGDVLISEILFNPVADGSDYVELYNAGDNPIELNRLRLARVDGNAIVKLFPVADSGALFSNEYLVVTTDATFVSGNYQVRYPACLVEVKSMPPYNNASGSVVVCTSDSLVLDRFDYDENMHSRLLRDREGVALERRSFQASTQEASNWYSAASTVGYGTPTFANSQSHEFLFVDDDFAVAVPLFSPDGDGYNDLLDITYSLERCDLSANVTVYDAHGHLVRHLLRGALIGCDGVLTWDGADDSGRRCPRGKYVVVVDAFNENGTKQSWRRTVSLVRK